MSSDIIEINDHWFRRELLKIKRTNDREEAYQTYIVYPVLECVLKGIGNYDYELIDTHLFNQRNTIKHDRRSYSSLAVAVPDLIIAKNFVLHNRDGENIECAVSVEIKKIDSDEMLNRSFSSDYSLYKDSLLEQLIPQLMRGQSVILTNLRVWEFIRVKKDINIQECPVYKYYLIIEKCGIDKLEIDNLPILENKLNVLIEFLKENSKKNKEIIEYVNESKKGLDIQKQKGAKLIKIFEKVVELANAIYKEEIKKFYENECDIKTKRILPNDKEYVIDYNVKRYHNKRNKYIKASEDITFVDDANIDNLIAFLKEEINSILV